MRTLRLALVGLCLVVLSGVATAKPKVALITFEGDPRGEAQDVVSEVLADDTQVIGHKEVNRTVDKLGLEVNDLADKDLRKLASELEADAIIQGKLSMKGQNHLLHFKLFVHGKKQKGFKIEFGSLKSAKFKEKLRDKIVAKIGGDDGGGATATKKKRGSDDDEENPLPGGKKKGDDAKKKKGGDDSEMLATMKKKGGDDEDAPPKKKGGDDGEDAPKKKGGDDDDGAPKKKGGDEPRKGSKKTARAGDDDGGEVEASSEEGGGVKLPAHAANRVAVRLDVGGSGQHRTLAFTSRSFPEAPKGYTDKNPIVGGVRIEGELYPLAFGNPMGVASGLGLGGMYDQNLGLKLTSSGQPGTAFPVTERRFMIGPRFRLVFGSKPTSPSLTLAADYGHRTFKVDRSALMTGNIIDLPDVDYAGFFPGLQFRLPIIERVALIVGGGAVLLTSAGPIQSADQYGQARVTGGQGMAAIDIVITSRIALKISGEATQIGFAFTGNGAQTNSRDMDPSTKDVGGAADRYVGGAATLAVLY